MCVWEQKFYEEIRLILIFELISILFQHLFWKIKLAEIKIMIMLYNNKSKCGKGHVLYCCQIQFTKYRSDKTATYILHELDRFWIIGQTFLAKKSGRYLICLLNIKIYQYTNGTKLYKFNIYQWIKIRETFIG